MLFSSIKEINWLISKGILNIHLKVTIEKNWRSQNFDFVSWKKSFPGQFLENYNSYRYHWTWNLKVWEQNCVWLFYYFNFERNSDVFKWKSPWLLTLCYYHVTYESQNWVFVTKWLWVRITLLSLKFHAFCWTKLYKV